MKNNYENPLFEILQIDCADVVTSSICVGDGGCSVDGDCVGIDTPFDCQRYDTN